MNKNFENSPYLPQKNRLFQNLITGQPVVGEKNKKFWSPQIYLGAHSRNPFVDIWYGFRGK
jgi:hypothetical protein